jgi:hypothetical protein
MGLALLDGIAFRVDPTSVNWNYTIKAAEIKTVGGKVIQVYGTDLGDMNVIGTFGRGGWQEQKAFLNRMKALADKQVRGASQRNSSANPSRFLWPARGWDFLVYLKQFSQPASPAGTNVYYDAAVFSPQWSLTFFMVTDNIGLRKIAQDDYIARLTQGLGWKLSKYNGPVDDAELQANLKGAGVKDFILQGFGISQSAPTVPAGAPAQGAGA